MAIRVAINGYGRIGRNVLRAHYEYGKQHDIEIVAINNPGEIETIALLTKYDTAHGKFPAEVSFEGNELIVNGDKIPVFSRPRLPHPPTCVRGPKRSSFPLREARMWMRPSSMVSTRMF